MPRTHVPLPLGHDWLVRRLQALGYAGNDKGMCYGFIPMVMQAIFVNDLNRFYKRLQNIASIPEEEFKETIEDLFKEIIVFVEKHKKAAAKYYDNLSQLDKEKINAYFENKKEFQENITALKKILDRPDFRNKFDKSILNGVDDDESARKIILNKYKNEFLRMAYIQYVIDRELLKLPEDVQLTLEIPAFFEGIEINQQGYIYLELSKEDEILESQNAFSTMQLISSKKLEQKKYVKSIHVFTDVYNKNTLTLYFNNFQKTIRDSYWQEPVFLFLQNDYHIIAVCFDPNRNENPWLVVDSNQQELLYQWIAGVHISDHHPYLTPESFSTPPEVAEKIINSFDELSSHIRASNTNIPQNPSTQNNLIKKSPSILSTEIYSREQKSNNFGTNLLFNRPNFTLDNLVMKWKEKNDLDGLHVVTKEKAMERNEFNSWIFLACRDNDIKSFDLLTKLENINLNEQFRLNKSLLHTAVEKNRLEIVKLLLNNRVKTDLKSQEGDTVLHFAVPYGSLELVQFLLKEINDVNPDLKNETNNDGQTPLHLAAYFGRLTILKLFLDYKADIDLKDKEGNTPLHIAAQEGRYKIVEFLLARNNLLKDSQNDSGETALHLAVQNGHLEIIELLLSNGADPNLIDKNKFTPLYQAVLFGQENIVKKLLVKGAKLFITASGYTPLHLAAREGNSNLVKILSEEIIKNNCNLNWRVNFDETALHLAAKFGHFQVAKVLLNFKEIDIDLKDLNGNTALHLAAAKGDYQLVRLLVNCGADLNTQNISGATASQLAKQNGHPVIVKLLTQKTKQTFQDQQAAIKNNSSFFTKKNNNESANVPVFFYQNTFKKIENK